jgi:hypothetical protein
MTQSFSGATFDTGSWSAGVDLLNSYTSTNILGTLNITSVTFTGTLGNPGALVGASLVLTPVAGPAINATSLTYVGFIAPTDGSGDPTYIIEANVAGIAGPVAFALSTDPAGVPTLTVATAINVSNITAPPSTNANPPCYVTGTLILTTRGEVAVENLKVGDEVVTSSGETRPIIWLGHKTLSHPTPAEWPVKVAAGAFAEGLPARDLFLSPGHAVRVDMMGEVFVPVEQLINGATIAREEVSEVTYWHVELESHDVLIAEGLPAESYMDAGNRPYFGREYGRLGAIDRERVAESLTRYAHPFVNAGPLLAAMRERLSTRAEALASAAPQDSQAASKARAA